VWDAISSELYLRLPCLCRVEGTYAVDEKDADLFSDTSSITGRSQVSSTDSSRMTSMTSSSLRSKTSGCVSCVSVWLTNATSEIYIKEKFDKCFLHSKH